ncbi:response regulator transcription factor [Massilia arenosa]|uniref:Response regulator transcription factor n=1 Tax=Zemynaea arenosa TaxID=2561931 RepID=A0A4Y9SL20_9BURK|nr:response regulator transcription factor [Massilia arenosa]TFW27360.1 response regulator transcription factor [Massilia arenosa]
MIKVLIADDHTILRDGLKQILAECPDIAVAGEANDGFEVLVAIRRLEDLDVLVLDMAMPGRAGLDLLRQVRIERPQLAVLVLSMHKESQYAVRTLKAGALGYLCKDSASADLVKAIRKVAGGATFLGSTVAENLTQGLAVSDDAPHARLSNREYEIFRLVAAGVGTSAIGHQLHLSAKTVSTHKTRILQKMGLTNTADLIRYAMKHGLADEACQPLD